MIQLSGVDLWFELGPIILVVVSPLYIQVPKPLKTDSLTLLRYIKQLDTLFPEEVLSPNDCKFSELMIDLSELPRFV